MSIQGSKPRKWIKNINYNNPTMHSHNVISIFNPEILRHYDSPIKYYRRDNIVENLPKRSWDQSNTIRNDSLDISLKNYNPNQYQHSLKTIQNNINQQREPKIWLSKSVIEPDIKYPLHDQNQSHSLNYRNSKSIKNKQLHGYNIISNF